MTAATPPPPFRFGKTFVLPALFVFLVPGLAFLFFRHAQSRFDSQIRDAILADIHADRRLADDERQRAVAFFTDVPASRLLANEQFAAGLPADTRFHYATFRWMIRISAASVLAGVGVVLLAGACVALSLHSQYVQYLSLSVGWHVLRVFGAAQTVAQGVLLVALSFWVTALWFNVYSVKLILVAGVLAVVGVCCVVAAIFRRVPDAFAVEGVVLGQAKAAPLWAELRRISDRVGTAPPDQVVAGIDDNFFVTERPVTVGGTTYQGRTLFVSLSLLKQLQGGEADAVLAHEMAHFHGQDTLYSRKVTPLLTRYDHYLNALREGGVTLPIYLYMTCFRALYELSLKRLSRQREFRADRLAAEATTARDMAAALARTVAYSEYRAGVERALFDHERALGTADVCARIERGFREYATTFVAGPDAGRLAPPHPFDSHPPLAERLHAVGVPLASAEGQSLLAAAGDGRWYRLVPDAEQIEAEQWRAYEDEFRRTHERSLPYRFLPETAEEREIVVAAFPPVNFTAGPETLTLDHDSLGTGKWPDPVRFAEVAGLALNDKGVLTVTFQRPGKQTRTVNLARFAKRQDVIDAINRYYGRYQTAAAYQKAKRESAAPGDPA